MDQRSNRLHSPVQRTGDTMTILPKGPTARPLALFSSENLLSFSLRLQWPGRWPFDDHNPYVPSPSGWAMQLNRPLACYDVTCILLLTESNKDVGTVPWKIPKFMSATGQLPQPLDLDILRYAVCPSQPVLSGRFCRTNVCPNL